MSSPHFDISILARAKGHSSVAAAAYRSGEKLYDARQKKYHDYCHRKDIAHTEIIAPDHVAAFLKNREALWNKIENFENRKDAQLARSIILGLPHELDHDEQVDLLRSYVSETFVKDGMIADIAIHKPDTVKGADRRNYHAHILLTLRQADRQGLYRTKTRQWNAKDLPVKWRAAWARAQNQAFQRKGLVLQLDNRTLKPRQKMEFAQHHFPKPYQFVLEPEKKLGRKTSFGYSFALQQNQDIVDRNLRTIKAKRKHYQKRQRQLEKLKTRRMKALAPHIPTLASDITQPFKDIKILAQERGRMKALLEKVDLVFQFLILLWGYEQALKRRQQLLHKLAKNLSHLDDASHDIERLNETRKNQQATREREAWMDPDRPDLPKTAKRKPCAKNPKIETARLRRRWRR